jgi:hypothetical protein
MSESAITHSFQQTGSPSGKLVEKPITLGDDIHMVIEGLYIGNNKAAYDK